MPDRRLTSLLFRLWIKLLGCPQRLHELRQLWREVRQFVRKHGDSR